MSGLSLTEGRVTWPDLTPFLRGGRLDLTSPYLVVISIIKPHLLHQLTAEICHEILPTGRSTRPRPTNILIEVQLWLVCPFTGNWAQSKFFQSIKQNNYLVRWQLLGFSFDWFARLIEDNCSSWSQVVEAVWGLQFSLINIVSGRQD